MSTTAIQSSSVKPQKGKKSSTDRTKGVIEIHTGQVKSYQKDPVIRATSLLGGAKTLGIQPSSPHDWLSLIRQGIPTLALDSLSTNTHVTNTELAQILGITTRKLAQRKHDGILSCQESERLLRVAQAIARAEDVFDDLNNALAWMRSPIIVLRGSTPFSLLDTEVGGEMVMQTLGRVQYGIPA